MPLSNTIEQYALVLKFDFLKIEFQCKTHFVENRVIGNKTFLKKNVELKFQNMGILLDGFKTKEFC